LEVLDILRLEWKQRRWKGLKTAFLRSQIKNYGRVIGLTLAASEKTTMLEEGGTMSLQAQAPEFSLGNARVQ
jgi:hypothetical protein